MPKLSFLLPCRTFSNDAETNALSIIEILDQVSINVPDGTNVNNEGVVPAPWAIVNLWCREPQDSGKKFEQRLTLVSSAGKVLISTSTELEMTALKHRMTLRVNGFPVAGPGIYLIKAETRELPSGNWKMQGEYPVEVVIA